jgi:hypothetical protein
MDLRSKIQKLLDEVPELRPDERKVLTFVVTTMPEGPLEEAMYPEARFQVEGRFEWFFTPSGARRQKAA